MELPRELRTGTERLEHIQLVLPTMSGWDFRCCIVTVGRDMHVWPNCASNEPTVAPNGSSEFTFKAGSVHQPLDDERRRKNYIQIPCFAEDGMAAGSSPILEHYLDTYPGFSWAEAWVDEIGYANSGRVLRFDPTGGATTELKWPVDKSSPLPAGAYELSMYVLVDAGYETLPMFKAHFELENSRFGENTLFTGCRGTRAPNSAAEVGDGSPPSPGCWQHVTATITLPSPAIVYDFTIIGAGKMGQGGFYATGLALHQRGRELEVSVEQNSQQLASRETKSDAPDGGTVHSAEVSLLGAEDHRAEFRLTVGYGDVHPNVDDDNLLVRFALLWKGGATGKVPENLNPASYNERVVNADVETSPDKPAGLAGFDQLTLRSHNDQELFCIRRRQLPAGGVGLELAVDGLFEPCGEATVDRGHEAARARGHCLGFTRLGRLRALRALLVCADTLGPKRLLIQVDVPARFWGDDRGVRVYADFRSADQVDGSAANALAALADVPPFKKGRVSEKE